MSAKKQKAPTPPDSENESQHGKSSEEQKPEKKPTKTSKGKPDTSKKSKVPPKNNNNTPSEEEEEHASHNTSATSAKSVEAELRETIKLLQQEQKRVNTLLSIREMPNLVDKKKYRQLHKEEVGRGRVEACKVAGVLHAQGFTSDDLLMHLFDSIFQEMSKLEATK